MIARRGKMPYYYHVSNKDFGQEFTLYPRGRGDNRSILEPKTSRICVGPTPWHCVTALGNCLDRGLNIYIYRTKTKKRGKAPHNVVDSEFTKERWLTNKTKFIMVGFVLDNDITVDFTTGAIFSLDRQKAMLPILRKEFHKLGFFKKEMEDENTVFPLQ